MQDLNTLIENVEKALWEMQEFFNVQPQEPGYNVGTCQNPGALKTYQLRIKFAEQFSVKQISLIKIDHEHLGHFLKEYYKDNPTKIRIGQAFCNRFKITNPALFYSDGDKAMDIIYKEYYKD